MRSATSATMTIRFMIYSHQTRTVAILQLQTIRNKTNLWSLSLRTLVPRALSLQHLWSLSRRTLVPRALSLQHLWSLNCFNKNWGNKLRYNGAWAWTSSVESLLMQRCRRCAHAAKVNINAIAIKGKKKERPVHPAKMLSASSESLSKSTQRDSSSSPSSSLDMDFIDGPQRKARLIFNF